MSGQANLLDAKRSKSSVNPQLMIDPGDSDYQQTKHFKKTGVRLTSPFKELAAWVHAQYEVVVLNVVYDTVIPNDRPRLSVIVELGKEASVFQDDRGAYKVVEQMRVKQRFEAILSEQGERRFRKEGLFVIFSAFEPVARCEANQCVTQEALESLQARLADPKLWKISTLFDSVTFFFHTDAQATKATALGLKEKYGEAYARLVEPYDEFGYLEQRGVSLSFDSKENFDENFKGNWFNYYK